MASCSSNVVAYNAYNPGYGLVPSSGYPLRNDCITKHNGVDYSTPVGSSAGTPIFAAMGGKVYQSGSAKGYGKWVVIETIMPDDTKTYTTYGHVVGEVKQGAYVDAGQQIGHIGTVTELKSGWGDKNPLGKDFTNPHLHLQINRDRINGPLEDPLNFTGWQGLPHMIDTDSKGNRLVVRESGSAAEGTYTRTVDILDKNTGERIGMILKQRSDLSDDYLQDFAQSGEMPSTIQVGEGSDATTYVTLPMRQEDVSDFLAANPQFAAQEGRYLPQISLMVAKEGERVRMPDNIDYIAVSSTDKIAFGTTPNTSGSNLINAADYDDYLRGALLSQYNLMGQGLIPQINMLSDMPRDILGSLGQGFSGLGLSQAGVSSVLPSSAQFMPSLGYVADPSATGLSAALGEYWSSAYGGGAFGSPSWDAASLDSQRFDLGIPPTPLLYREGSPLPFTPQFSPFT